MDRPARPITPQLGKVEGLDHDPLAGKGSVPMDEDGQNLPVALRAPLLLLRPDHAFQDRIDRFQMARIGDELYTDHRAVGGLVLAGESKMIFDVAGSARGLGIKITFELAEQLVVVLADDVGEDVETAPVRHPHHGFFHPARRRRRQHRVEHRDDRLRPFEAEALVSRRTWCEGSARRLPPD